MKRVELATDIIRGGKQKIPDPSILWFASFVFFKKTETFIELSKIYTEVIQVHDRHDK